MSTPTELAWRDSRPADEGAREMRVVGVANVEGDIDDLARRILEHPACGVETGTGYHGSECQALLRQPALEGSGAEPYDLRDRSDVGRTVGQQSGHDLLHAVAEPRNHRGTWPRPVDPSRSCSTQSR